MFHWFDELKTSFEKEVELGKTKFFLNAIGQPFEVPQSARPLQLIENFDPFNTQVVLDDGITIEENCWKVESYGQENKLLVFECPKLNLLECFLVFQVKLKAIHSNQQIGVFLKGCDFHGLGGTIARMKSITKGWSIYEFPFNYRKNKFSQNFTFGLKFQSEGLLWVKNIDILQAFTVDKE